jgi:bifunctional DNase/RNase
MMIPVDLASIVINERSDEQVITLREQGPDGARQFPIVIGMFEAFAIDRIVKERTCERPLTHDLMASLVRSLEASVARITIDDVKDDGEGGATYFAKVILRRGESDEVVVDARPSDAITLALKTGAPMFVAARVLDAAAS